MRERLLQSIGDAAWLDVSGELSSSLLKNGHVLKQVKK